MSVLSKPLAERILKLRSDLAAPYGAVEKRRIIRDRAGRISDTGTPEVQVAVLTERINSLTEQFKQNKKDIHSRRGLLKMVSQRRLILDDLKRKDATRYQTVVDKLGIRR